MFSFWNCRYSSLFCSFALILICQGFKYLILHINIDFDVVRLQAIGWCFRVWWIWLQPFSYNKLYLIATTIFYILVLLIAAAVSMQYVSCTRRNILLSFLLPWWLYCKLTLFLWAVLGWRLDAVPRSARGHVTQHECKHGRPAQVQEAFPPFCWAVLGGLCLGGFYGTGDIVQQDYAVHVMLRI